MRIATTLLHALWETTIKTRKPMTTACSPERGDSFPILSPPYQTLFTTLTLGLELHPFKAFSVGRQALRRFCKCLKTCQPMSICLTTCALLQYPQLLFNRPSTATKACLPQSAYAVTILAAIATLAGAADPLAMQRENDTVKLEVLECARAVYVSEKPLWNQENSEKLYTIVW